MIKKMELRIHRKQNRSLAGHSAAGKGASVTPTHVREVRQRARAEDRGHVDWIVGRLSPALPPLPLLLPLGRRRPVARRRGRRALRPGGTLRRRRSRRLRCSCTLATRDQGRAAGRRRLRGLGGRRRGVREPRPPLPGASLPGVPAATRDVSSKHLAPHAPAGNAGGPARGIHRLAGHSLFPSHRESVGPAAPLSGSAEQ